MNLKRRLLFLVYAVLLVGMCYSGLQLVGEKSAQAEAATCCSDSTQCPNERVCYTASGLGLEACCVSGPGLPACSGSGYCFNPPLAD